MPHIFSGSAGSVFKQKQRRSLWVLPEFGWRWQGRGRQERPCLPAGSAVFPVPASLVPQSPGQASARGEAALPVSTSAAGLAHRWLPHGAGLCRGSAAEAQLLHVCCADPS